MALMMPPKDSFTIVIAPAVEWAHSSMVPVIVEMVDSELVLALTADYLAIAVARSSMVFPMPPNTSGRMDNPLGGLELEDLNET